MKLRFKVGAIVRLKLIDNTIISGKVSEILDDEVTLIDQFKISDKLTHRYSRRITADRPKVIHVNREFIKCWEYEQALNFNNGIVEGGFDDLNEVHYDKLLVFNHYDEDGFCKGE